MKTTILSFAAALVGGVFANPLVPLEFTAGSLIEDRATASACQQIAKLYPASVGYPNTTLYNTEQGLFWSEATVLAPTCVFAPTSCYQMAGTLKILVATNTKFAVRSGGHMPNVGANNVNGGVLIGTDKLNGKSLSKFNGIEVAQIGPGNRWTDVYSWLVPQGKLVNGGRYSPVGVGGLLVGGGLSYFTSVAGWASDHVLNYEVVLANGTIKQISRASNPDLFWALKGGSSNFAIVTRYDIQTYPIGQIYAGYVNQDTAHLPQLLSATANFVAPTTGGSLDPLAAIDVTIYYNGSTKAFTSTTSLFYNASIDTAPKALQDFTEIPTSIPSTVHKRSYTDFETETISSGVRTFRQLFRATSTVSKPAVVKFLYDIFVQQATPLKSVPGLIASFVYQPLTVAHLKASKATGGDAIDLDPADGPVMMMILNVAWENAADDTYIHTWAKNLTDTIEVKTKAAGYYYPFVFLNDAETGQEVLGLYGKGKSLPRMKTIAKKYDPNGVFQTLDGGAFHLATQ